nr:Friend leukemia integration 1 transcription factor-like [Procambarus clarkii]XP_045596572.1 Friend leukemia integration 1 transcription factor-like [Procambarus clarkii]XP_045596573.1 Friend leukemia integration 1 transcription factor-like [Procambarus clarkii]XP_045596574.1 Friend leukemia integration 1 transcription factor-like [Procambarus clarkii]XP_045596575.1 Friend leukemia integration 1 transcription factor-like [Procambarus clarkii]
MSSTNQGKWPVRKHKLLSAVSQDQLSSVLPRQPDLPSGSSHQPSVLTGSPHQPSVPSGSPHQPSVPCSSAHQDNVSSTSLYQSQAYLSPHQNRPLSAALQQVQVTRLSPHHLRRYQLWMSSLPPEHDRDSFVSHQDETFCRSQCEDHMFSLSQQQEYVLTKSPQQARLCTGSPHQDQMLTRSPQQDRLSTRSSHQGTMRSLSPNPRRMSSRSPHQDQISSRSPYEDHMSSPSPYQDHLSTGSPSMSSPRSYENLSPRSCENLSPASYETPSPMSYVTLSPMAYQPHTAPAQQPPSRNQPCQIRFVPSSWFDTQEHLSQYHTYKHPDEHWHRMPHHSHQDLYGHEPKDPRCPAPKDPYSRSHQGYYGYIHSREDRPLVIDLEEEEALDLRLTAKTDAQEAMDQDSQGTHDSLKKISTKRKRDRGPKSWEFLMRLLADEATNPSVIRWEDEAAATFRLVQPQEIARMWGTRSCKPNLTYNNFARALRYHYSTKYLTKVSERQLVYGCGHEALKFLAKLKNQSC